MQNIPQNSRAKKILLLYVLIVVVGFIIFLATMLFIALKPRHIPSVYTSTLIHAKRGEIITSDGYRVAITKKLYKAVVNRKFIKKDKEKMFVKLFSIYSNIKESIIKRRLYSKKGVVVLSYNIDVAQAQNLVHLSRELLMLKVFKAIKNPYTHIKTIQGLNIVPSGEARIYPFKTFLTPVIGYTHKVEQDGYTTVHGIKGLEKEYDNELSPRQNEIESGLRDANGYIILNGKSKIQRLENGLNLKLNISANIQTRVENILDKMKKKFQAKQITAVIMNAHSGAILSMATSNRYFPQDILKRDYPSLKNSATEFLYAPGSVLKPLTFSILLDKHLVNPYELVNGHNGVYHLGRMTIRDDTPFAWISAENVIVYSSNIGMSQLAQRLSALTFYNGLRKFGLTFKTGIDLPYEYSGSIPSVRQLQSKIYKATTSYGYGVRITLMQLIKAYNAFNNNGTEVTPKVANGLISDQGTVTKIFSGAKQRVISSSTASIMKNILIKTVTQGTGKAAITNGITIGGKTGTAHIVKNGGYIDQYNSTFIGFADTKNKDLTIGVLVRQPHVRDYYAAGTAVPTFKKIVDMLIAQKYLNPDIVKKSGLSH